jgi:GGDEF domain-containing protein
VAPARITDPETGLHNEIFLLASFPTRVALARRLLRPASIALLAVSEAEGVPGRCSPAAARLVARGLRECLRESDTPCRLDDGGFGLILEDTPEDGAVWTIDRFRRRLPGHLTLWAGVGCYPAHGLEAGTILGGARSALVDAQLWATSRIEVALPEG